MFTPGSFTHLTIFRRSHRQSYGTRQPKSTLETWRRTLQRKQETESGGVAFLSAVGTWGKAHEPFENSVESYLGVVPHAAGNF